MRRSNKGHLFPFCCLTLPSLPQWPHFLANVSDLSTVPSTSEERPEKRIKNKKIFDTVIHQNRAKTVYGSRRCSWFHRWMTKLKVDWFRRRCFLNTSPQCVAGLNPLTCFFFSVSLTWKVWPMCTVLTPVCAFHPHSGSLEKLPGWTTNALLSPLPPKPVWVVVNATVL